MGVSFIRWFFRVHKCGGCGEILIPERYYETFCEKCELAWKASLTESCENCFLPAVECRCMPKQLSGAGALCLRKLFFYKNESSHSPQMNLIYLFKHRRVGRMIDFAADNLAKLVLDELGELGISENPEKFIVSFVPRGRRGVTEYGYDHAALIAEALAKTLGLECAPLLASRLGAKVQKELDKKQRLENARKNIYFDAKYDLSGKAKYVILVDDVVTSGASMTVSVKSLIKNGASGVFCFSLARKK